MPSTRTGLPVLLVTVIVSAGSKSAHGSGRLSGAIGAGSWKGGDCAGTWEAEKRG